MVTLLRLLRRIKNNPDTLKHRLPSYPCKQPIVVETAADLGAIYEVHTVRDSGQESPVPAKARGLLWYQRRAHIGSKKGEHIGLRVGFLAEHTYMLTKHYGIIAVNSSFF